MIEVSNKIVVKEGNKIHLFKTEDIIMVKADRYYVNVFYKDKKILIRKTLKKLAEVLPDNFVRISKSLIVNTICVERVDELKSSCTLFISDGIELQVTPKYKTQFEERMNEIFPSLQENDFL